MIGSYSSDQCYILVMYIIAIMGCDEALEEIPFHWFNFKCCLSSLHMEILGAFIYKMYLHKLCNIQRAQFM